MNGLFSGKTSFNEDISTWDVQFVTDMSSMFYQASTFNQNIGSWDVASVTSMEDMFREAAAFDQNIGSWNVASVTSTRRMFRKADAFNQDISGWDVSSVIDMRSMFGTNSGYTDFDQNLCAWNGKLPSSAAVGYSFFYTSCPKNLGPANSDPKKSYGNWDGPFCYVC